MEEGSGEEMGLMWHEVGAEETHGGTQGGRTKGLMTSKEVQALIDPDETDAKGVCGCQRGLTLVSSLRSVVEATFLPALRAVASLHSADLRWPESQQSSLNVLGCRTPRDEKWFS